MDIRFGDHEVTVERVSDIDLDQDEIYVDGERLTEARADELARAIARRHGRKGGRPRVGDGPTAQIAVRVPASMKEQLATVAAARHVSESELMRDALQRFLETATQE